MLKMCVDNLPVKGKDALNLRLLSGSAKTTLRLMQERFRSASLRFKIALLAVILLSCTSIALCIITVQIVNKYVLSEIVKRGESVGKHITTLAKDTLSSRDVSSLDNLLFQAKLSNIDIESIAIVTPDNKIVAHSERKKDGEFAPTSRGKLISRGSDGSTVKELSGSSDSLLEISCPIVSMNQPMGNVVVIVNKSVLLKAQGEVHSKIFLVSNIILILGTIAGARMASFLMRPIKELSIGVDELKKGVAKGPLKIYSDDELGRLTVDFNEMLSTIATQQNKLNRYSHDLEEAYISIVRVVAAAIDARDSYTHGHSARVSQLSLLIGRSIGLSPEELKDLEVACLFHDVGKIKTPDSILLKQGGLIQYEYEEMIHHVEYGVYILDKAPTLRRYIPAVRHHHERQDGKGYPDGLSGESIPIFAAIIAVADTFDAMTSDRPYRKAFSKEEALRELVRVAGTQLRPDLVSIFVRLMRNRTPEHVVSSFARAV